MEYLPLTPPGETPLRVLTIAGTDSGGGAGIQADSRTFAMLGVHGCVAVVAVTVQNSVGVKGFHEIPLDIIVGQIDCVASDIGGLSELIRHGVDGVLVPSRDSRAISEAVLRLLRDEDLRQGFGRNARSKALER